MAPVTPPRPAWDLESIGWAVSDLRALLADHVVLHPVLRPVNQAQALNIPTSQAAWHLAIEIFTNSDGLTVRLRAPDGLVLGQHRWYWAEVCDKCHGQRYVYQEGVLVNPCPACLGTGAARKEGET
jgi:hypothetical protein